MKNYRKWALILTILISWVVLGSADISLPSDQIYTDSTIDITWKLSSNIDNDINNTSIGYLIIINTEDGSFNVIDDHLNTLALSKTWNINVPSGIYLFALNDGSKEYYSEKFTILEETEGYSDTHGSSETYVASSHLAFGCILPVFHQNWRYFFSSSSSVAGSLREVEPAVLLDMTPLEYFTRHNPLPGPFPLPFLGNSHLFTGDASIAIQKLYEKYGDMWELYVGSRRQIWLCRADLVERIFHVSVKSNFLKRSPPNKGLDELGVSNNGLIFNQDLDGWHRSRSFINKVIVSPKFLRQSVPWTQSIFEEIDQYWSELGEDTVFEFNKWMKYFFMDKTFLLLMNIRTHTLANYYNKLSPNKKVDVSETFLIDSNAFLKCTESSTKSVLYFYFFPTIIRHFPGINLYTRHLLRQWNQFTDYLRKIVGTRREEIASTPENQELSPDILTLLLISNTPRDFIRKENDENKPMDEEDIIANMRSLLVGSIETLPSTMCFVVYYLARYPQVKKLVFQELDEIFGKNIDRNITPDDIPHLKYCEAVIKEVLRILPITPATVRISSGSDEIGEINFPENTEFGINISGIHMNKAHWKDPERFDPGRFLEVNDHDPHAFIPFGGGLRICPSKNMTISGIKNLMALIYRKYDIELSDINAPIKYVTTTTRRCSELKVKIKRRNL
ncbi:8601_t:CDS:2 [Acaulospora morrowiae]|uniref:8601_t:CDS:1 n=1 Tax=Acaulospora morrowiae TaxID=94023 RepID=A0A9N9AUB5_9GLOM|nr:8601_t:CDS:2 [Acaulospora morrowiae]